MVCSPFFLYKKGEIMRENIRLINGDCREIIKDLKKQKIIIVTDPPFNINYRYNTYKDNLKEEEYLKFICDILGETPFALIHYPESLYKICGKLKRYPERVVSWVYNSNTQRQHRDIAFVGVKPDFKKVLQPYKNPNDKRIQERISRGLLGCKLYDWFNINQVKNVSKVKTKHPCQMPLEVMENIIGILPEDYIIVDPFMGSGTTGVVCKKLGRKFVGIEIDKEYFNIAETRINETR